jgi:hypothetical protein
MRRDGEKEKRIVFIVGRKKSNGQHSTTFNTIL